MELHNFGIGMEIFRFLGGILGEYTRTFLASFVFLNYILDTASQFHLNYSNAGNEPFFCVSVSFHILPSSGGNFWRWLKFDRP
jgi:hypothetical protein